LVVVTELAEPSCGVVAFTPPTTETMGAGLGAEIAVTMGPGVDAAQAVTGSVPFVWVSVNVKYLPALAATGV
jgi:hypothetical protein